MQIIDELTKILQPYNVTPHFYIDRFHIYLDACTQKSNLKWLILCDCPETNDEDVNKLLFQTLPYHVHLDRKLELFQPKTDDLIYLDSNNGVRGDYAIQYVEFALDFESKNFALLERLQAFFDKHMVLDLMPNRKKKTFHWVSSKGDKNSGNSEEEVRYFAESASTKVLAMYMRKQSKIHPLKSCLHIEWRFTGIQELKSQGLLTLQQLINFEHTEFWNERLDIREPNLTTLGQSMIIGSCKTRQADFNRGKRKWSETKALQQFLSLNPHYAAAFSPIATVNKLTKYLLPFLEPVKP